MSWLIYYYWITFVISFWLIYDLPDNQSKTDKFRGSLACSIVGFCLWPICLCAYIQAGSSTYRRIKPTRITVSISEYEKLKADADRYNWLKARSGLEHDTDYCIASFAKINYCRFKNIELLDSHLDTARNVEECQLNGQWD